ncbi:MAG: hypothetical protein HYU63_04905, partial [Armatimonadetes bacterium]|nr:hypothetical protein [Armatimonadota bacterium]
MTEKTPKGSFRQNEFKNVLPEIVKDLIKSLNKKNSPDHIGSPIIPSWESLIEIIELMEILIYPGYFGEQELDFKNLNIYFARQINKLFKLLSSQVSKCLMHECKNIHSKTYRDCVNIGKKES